LSFSETFDTPARRFLGTTPNQRFGVNGGDDSQIAPQAIEIAQNGLANDEPKGSCPVAKHFVSPKQGLRRRREVF
jgi:hypothetical protein